MKSLFLAAALLAGASGAAHAQDTLTPEQIFTFVDSNGDNAVSFEEINEANAAVTQEVFDAFDDDGDGELSLEEFKDLAENGPPPPGL